MTILLVATINALINYDKISDNFMWTLWKINEKLDNSIQQAIVIAVCSIIILI